MQSSASPPATPRSVWTGLLMAGLGALGFSGKAIIVKLGYRHGADAVTLLGLRMLFALPMFLGLAWWAGQGRDALARRDWWAVIGLGFSGYYLASFLDFAGLAYISAGFERLILYLNPTLVLLLGWLLLGRRLAWRQVVALAISYAGVLWVFAQELHWQGEHAGLGALLVLGSALSYALYLLYSGEEVHRLGAMRLTGLASSVACLLCVGQYLLLRGPAALSQVPGEVVQLSLLNAVLCTFAPVLLVMLAIERLGAAVTAQTGMLGPMATIALGAWLLDEPLTTGVLGGTVLVLGGILLLNRWR